MRQPPSALRTPQGGQTKPLSFTLEATDGYARAGVVHTPHGDIHTPIFMPVGTRSALKGLTTDQIRDIGAEIMLVNNYHSYLRPGTEVVESFGGLHKFMDVDLPILTDSGGFQVFSLGKASFGKEVPRNEAEDSLVSGKAYFGKEVPRNEAEDSLVRDTSLIRIPFRSDLSEKATELRKNMTGPEKKIWYEVLSRDAFKGYRFLRQKPLLDYIVDFYCHDLQLVIEIDGESHLGNEEYDTKRTNELLQEGVQVVRFTNEEVINNLSGVCEKLSEVVSERENQKQQQRIPPTPLSKGGNPETVQRIPPTPLSKGGNPETVQRIPPTPLSKGGNPETVQRIPPTPLSKGGNPETVQRIPPTPLSKGGNPETVQRIPPTPLSKGGNPETVQRIPPTPLSKGGNMVQITEEGVHFRSYLDGSKHFFTPESVMDMQCAFGADIIMAFDECAPGGSTHEYARAAMERTHRWAERSRAQWLANEEKRAEQGLYPQALFGIIQGVVYDDLRVESAEFIKNLDTPGIAIGGLSVGESKEDMYRIMDVLAPHLPESKPHYLMGVGTPEDLVEGMYRGIDMFDCVLATRIGRHGEAFSSYGNIKIGGEKYKFSQDKISMLPEHETQVSRRYSLGYLRHLVNVGEATGGLLLSLHNIEYLLNLTKTARVAILAGKYNEFRERFWSVYPKK